MGRGSTGFSLCGVLFPVLWRDVGNQFRASDKDETTLPILENRGGAAAARCCKNEIRRTLKFKIEARGICSKA